MLREVTKDSLSAIFSTTDVVINQLDDVPVLLRNVNADRNHWVDLKLIGGPKSPRDAVGAADCFTAGGMRQRADVLSGRSFASSNDQRRCKPSKSIGPVVPWSTSRCLRSIGFTLSKKASELCPGSTTIVRPVQVWRKDWVLAINSPSLSGDL